MPGPGCTHCGCSFHRVVIVDTDKPSIIYTDDDVVQVDEARAESGFVVPALRAWECHRLQHLAASSSLAAAVLVLEVSKDKEVHMTVRQNLRRVLFQNLSACVDFECKHTILRCGTCYANLVEQPFKPLRARRRDGCGVVSCKYATEALGRELFPLASLPRVCQRGFARTGWQRCGRHRCKDVCHFLKRQGQC